MIRGVRSGPSGGDCEAGWARLQGRSTQFPGPSRAWIAHTAWKMVGNAASNELTVNGGDLRCLECRGA